MRPDDILAFLAFVIAVSIPVKLVSMVLRHKRAKMEIETRRYQAPPQDNSLPLGELKRLIGEAVEASTRPLQERMAQIEALLPRPTNEEESFSSTRTVGKNGTTA